MDATQLTARTALLIVDVQNDFLPGGSLGVPHGADIIAGLNRVIGMFASRGLPIFATRDWHPPKHISFKAQGGPWPPHCIANSEGAAFAAQLQLPPSTIIVSKGCEPGADAYSGFEGTNLANQLRALNMERLVVGGLATDYCVLNSVTDALTLGFEVILLEDAIRAVELHPGDGQAAIVEMVRRGAQLARAGSDAAPGAGVLQDEA